MIEWWNTLSLVMKILWGLTISVSLIFVIQSILTFVGAGADTDFDTDIPDDLSTDADASTGMGLLTFRNFINFFLGFGWSAILLHDKIESVALLTVFSIVVGVLLVSAVMMLFKWLANMQQSGNIDVFTQAVGCEGKVYLTIPGNRSGEGKVLLNINNSVREYQALTDGESIPTGTEIRVVEAVSSTTVLVEKIESIII